jgi:hypothetical protein
LVRHLYFHPISGQPISIILPHGSIGPSDHDTKYYWRKLR